MTNKSYPCLLIAGEKSGEDHALSFISSLKANIPDLKLFGVGGDGLQNKGMELIYHLNDFSSFGFSEVIFQIPFYIKAFNRIVSEVRKRKCKVAILIDFQTFNLKLAQKLQKEGVEILYYVAPQAWAWKAYRAGIIEKTVHTLFTIIPFEQKWFEDRGVTRVKSIAHPLLINYAQEIKTGDLGVEAKPFERFEKEIKIVLLPGSRKFEVKLMLPIYIDAIKKLKQIKKISTSLVISPSIPSSFYSSYLDKFDKTYTSDELPEALKEADFAIATSGTVTLTCALFEVPTIVGYRASLLNELIYTYFIQYDGYVSLANIVHQKELFPEKLKDNCTGLNIKNAILPWINDKNKYNKIKGDLSKTIQKIGGELTDVSGYMAEVLKQAYDTN